MKPGKPLTRKTPLKASNVRMRQGSSLPASSKPLPKESPRTKAARPKRRATVEETKARDRVCQAAHLLPTPCAGILETHEKLSRARSGGTSQYDASLTALLCSEHHRHVTGNPTWAESVDLLLPSRPLAKSQLLFNRKEAS